MNIFQKKMSNPLYYLARSLRIRRFVMNCMPVFVLVEMLLIAFFILICH